MKCGRKYILPFFTLFVALFFVVLGATLPYLASQMQDAQNFINLEELKRVSKENEAERH